MTLEQARTEPPAPKTTSLLFIAGIAAVGVYVLPHLVLGQGSYVRILDSLDSEFVYRTVLVHSSNVFKPDARIAQIMNGLPRRCLHSELSVVTWFFMMFEPFTAYVLNKLAVHLAAFVGMWLLLRRYVLPNTAQVAWAFGAALCFAVLPFYSAFGLMVAGQPLLAYSILNFYNKRQRWPDILVVAIFPFYSTFYQAGIFVPFIVAGLLLYDSLRRRQINRGLLAAAAGLAVGYVLVEHNLIYLMFFDPNFVSHRTAWALPAHSYGLLDAARESAVTFFLGQYHAASLHTPVFVAVGLVFLKILKDRDLRKRRQVWLIGALLMLAAAIAVFYGFYRWEGLIALKRHIALLKTFNFARLNWFYPLIWYLILAAALAVIASQRRGRIIAAALIAGQLAFSLGLSGVLFSRLSILNAEVTANEFAVNVRMVADRALGRKPTALSYWQFFSEPLFKEIDEYIGRPKKDYRVVSIGLYPSIAQYNGFYTLDSYQFNYPLEYKKQFRRIIAGELAKSEKWRQYFDGWGSRCYIFAAELEDAGFGISKDKNVKIAALDLDSLALKEMGGEYVFSAVEIQNAAATGLRLLKIFERPDSPWRIYLYQAADTGRRIFSDSC